MLYIIRHGETVYNSQDRFQGVSDSPLTETGVRQTELKRDYFKNHLRSAKFLISPLPRVRQTFDIIARDVIVSTCEVLPELSEICYGEWEAQTKESLKHLPAWNERKQDRYNFIHPGLYKSHIGESYRMLYDRLIPFWEKVKGRQEENLIIIAHHGVMLVAKKYFQNLSDDEASGFRPENTLILQCRYIKQKFNCTEIYM